LALTVSFVPGKDVLSLEREIRDDRPGGKCREKTVLEN
jgi:hypothetical protein